MKILVVSDSHGETEDLRWVLERVCQDYGPMNAFIHCGDGGADLLRLRNSLLKQNPNASFHTVAGNCDLREDIPTALKLTFDGVNIFVAHGHTFYVKSGLAEIDQASASEHCVLTLYGHTHVPNWEMRKTLNVNPGAAYKGRAALITVENGTVKADLLEY